MLSKPYWETGPFRGYVEKLLVSPLCRRVGVARALMLKVEEVAREKGRTLLVRLRSMARVREKGIPFADTEYRLTDAGYRNRKSCRSDVSKAGVYEGKKHLYGDCVCCADRPVL